MLPSKRLDLRRTEFSPSRLPFFIGKKSNQETQSTTSIQTDTRSTERNSKDAAINESLSRQTFIQSVKQVLQQSEEQRAKLRSTFSPSNYGNQKLRFSSNHRSERLFQNQPTSPRSLGNIQQTLDNLESRIKSARLQMFKKNKQHTQVQAVDMKQVQVPTPSKRTQQDKQRFRSSFLSNLNRPTLTHSPMTHNPYVGEYTYYVSELVRAGNEKNSLAMQHLTQSIRIIKCLDSIQAPRSQEVQEGKLDLKRSPNHEGKKTIVFDLDQTLIHCSQNTKYECDVVLTIKPKGESPSQVRIHIRPYALTLLKNLAREFQLIIFTASQECYANVVLDYIDPQNKLFSYKLYRQHCYNNEHGFIKDLRIINRPLSEMVIIDNSAYSYCLQLQNAIPIFPYYQGDHDFEFKALEKYLHRIRDSQDVREVNKQTFKLHLYNKYAGVEQLIREVYPQS